MTQKKIFTVMIAFSIVCAFSACMPVTNLPDDGEWYCSELEMQLDFGGNGECFIEKDGKKIQCVWENDIGSNCLSVFCQEINCEYCSWGKEILVATIISRDDTKLVLEDSHKESKYLFVKIN